MTEKSNQSLGKRGFNLPHVFSWQIVVLLAIYALVLVYEMYEMASWDSFVVFGYEDTGNNLSSVTFVAGLIVSLVQFRFLQVKNKCITILSFGESRKSLFRKKFWLPLGAMVLITIGFYVILLCGNEEYNKKFHVLADEYFADMLIALLPLMVGYTVGAFARIMSGKTDETLAFGASVCAFPFALFMVVDGIFSLSLKGYYSFGSEYYNISNYTADDGHTVTTILSLFDPLYTLNINVYGFGNENVYSSLWYEMPAFYIIKNLSWIFILIALVFVIEKHFVKKFKAECCDKSGKNKAVITMCALTIGLGVVAFCLNAFYKATLNDALPEISVSMLIAALIWSLIMTLILTALLYRKGTKLRYSLLGVAVTAGISVVIYVISITGCFGYSTYIPDTKKIKAVMINDVTNILRIQDSGYFRDNDEIMTINMSFKSQEEIEKVKDIHKFIITDENRDITETFAIIYELENGELIYRTYSCLSDEACEKISTLWETQTIRDYYRVIFNQDEELNRASSKEDWKSWEKSFAFNTNSKIINDIGFDDEYYFNERTCNRTIADADSLVIYSKDDMVTLITNEEISPETMERLKKALYKDYMNMSAQQNYAPEKQLGIISLASCATLLEEAESGWWDEDELGERTAEEVLDINHWSLYRFPITSDMVNTIKVLKEADVYKYFNSDLKISEAHLIDSQKLIKWMNSDSVLDSVMLTGLSSDNSYMSGILFGWEDYDIYNYLEQGCGYLPVDPDEYGEYESLLSPISESDVEKITPEEAEKLRGKAFMTYNAGNDCQFLVMKYTDGTANMLVIPN